MATWNKSKVNSSDVNNGNQFNAGDGVRNTDINKIFESGLYSQDIVENIGIGTVTTSASGSNANASVTYDSTTGYPKINLVLPRGEKGEKGETGSVENLSEIISGFWGTITIGETITFSKKYDKLIMFVGGDNKLITSNMSYATFVNYIGSRQSTYLKVEFQFDDKQLKITRGVYMSVYFNEDGTFSLDQYDKLSGDTISDFALIGLNF